MRRQKDERCAPVTIWSLGAVKYALKMDKKGMSILDGSTSSMVDLFGTGVEHV